MKPIVALIGRPNVGKSTLFNYLIGERALIGRPNVGKSTLFNYLIGERKAIVEDTPGVTRDRIYGNTTWRGKEFTIIDTGGIEEKTGDVISEQIKIQSEIAIEMADLRCKTRNNTR